MTPKDIKQGISKIRQAVAEDDLSQAIQLLIHLAKTTQQEEEHNEAVAISADFTRLEKEIRQLLLDGNQISLQRNRLMDRILDLCKEIEDPEPLNTSTPTASAQAPSGGSNTKFIIGLFIGIGLVAALYFGAKAFGTDDPREVQCQEYLRSGRIAFDLNKYEEARLHFINAKHNCSSPLEAIERIAECERLLALAQEGTSSPPTNPNPPTDQSEQQSSDATTSDDANAGTNGQDGTATRAPGNFANRATRKKIKEGIMQSRFNEKKLSSYQHVMNTRDVQRMRGSASLRGEYLNSPSQILFVGGVYNEKNKRDIHPTAVWYHQSKWNLYHPNLQTFSANQSYNVFIANKASQDVAIHNATRDNTNKNLTTLSEKFSDPRQILFVTPVFTGESISRNEHSIGLYFSGGRWNICNLNLRKMPVGTRFHLYKGNASNSFVHTCTSANTKGGATIIDHPMANGKADKLLFAIQNWQGGTANASEIGLQYNARAQQWVIRNQNDMPIPIGTKFNVLVVDTL
ncbi:MAG: hypothetical protein AAFV95_05225 [Bacteroidota bacterium]